MKMTNRWNQFIYRLWAPIYDSTVGHFFSPGRKRAMELLDLQPGERVLLVGVGTGADLPLLPAGVAATGIDLSPVMLAKARRRLPLAGRDVTLLQGDAQRLQVDEGGYDAVVFNLILSVIPDGAACLRENLRALKPGGRRLYSTNSCRTRAGWPWDGGCLTWAAHSSVPTSPAALAIWREGWQSR